MAEDQEEKKSKSEEVSEEAGRIAGRQVGRKMAEGAAARGAGSAAGTGAGTTAGTTAGTAGGTAAAGAGGAAAGTSGGAAAGATAGSVVPGAGTAAGAVVGAVAGTIIGKFGKYILFAIGGIVLMFFFMFLIVIILVVSLFTGRDGGAPPPQPTELCSPIPTTLDDDPAIITRINQNEDTYRSAAAVADIPWEMLAAIHYLERNNQANLSNMYQFDPPPPGVDVDNFAEASLYAANFVQGKAQNGPVGRPLRADMDPSNPEDQETIKDAFWGYNGRADYMRRIAEDLGFDPATEGYEGSHYVMNNWDAARVGMKIIFTDDTGKRWEFDAVRDGAWKVFILLRNATYDDQGKITQLNEACLAESSEKPFGCPLGHGKVGGYIYHDPRNPGHVGIDMSNLNNVDGNRVRATHSGTVTWVSQTENPTAGYWVVVENANYKTRYLHLEAGIPVTVGQKVVRGTAVGIESDTGLAEGVHLHYEVYVNGAVTNPTTFIPMSNVKHAECKTLSLL